jgi:hypothetical protein
MYRKHKVTPQAARAIAAYGRTFPSAYKFLGSIASNQIEGFWLSTDTNAHLYYENAFFAYIKFYPLELEFNMNPHVKIVDGTVERSSKIFGQPLRMLAEKHKLIDYRLVTFTGSDTMYVKRDTPVEFFVDLISLIMKTYERLPK